MKILYFWWDLEVRNDDIVTILLCDVQKIYDSLIKSMAAFPSENIHYNSKK